MIRKITVIILCVGLLACQHSPRKHYFVLSTAPLATQNNERDSLQQNVAINNNSLIGIGPIDIADYLDRLHIVYTENDNTLTVLDNDYWAEELDKGITRVIAFNLSQVNSNRNFVTFPWRSDSKPQYSFRVHIHSLTRTANQASIDASWELIDNNSKSNMQRRHFIQTTPIGASTKELVQGYSKLLTELAQDMNASLNKLQ